MLDTDRRPNGTNPGDNARPTDRSPRRRSNPRAKRRAVTVVAIAGLVAVVVVALWPPSPLFHTGGDPGNKGLHRFELIKTGVPTTATQVTVQAAPTAWETNCGAYGHSGSGWSEVQYEVDFDDAAPAAAVLAHLRTDLASLGWVEHDVATGPHQGALPHWRLGSSGSTRPTAWLFPIPAGSDHWTLEATWQPPGPVAPECP
jgi:hypothetical protein